MRELLDNDIIKSKIKFNQYYIQWYSKKYNKWFRIDENIWLKSYIHSESKVKRALLDICWQKYGIYGILSKRLAVMYLKDLREAVKNNSEDLGIASHISMEDIGGFRICKCHYKIKAKVLDI